MFHISKNLKLLNAVMGVGFDGEHLVLCDNAHGIFVYSMADQKLVVGKRVASKEAGKYHIYSKALACSDHEELLIPEIESPLSKLYRVVEDRITLSDTFKWHKANVSCCVFSGDSSFFATGGEDGRVYVLTTKDARFYAMCPIQADYIACVAFDSKNERLAFGTYDCKLLVYDLRTYEFVLELRLPSVVADLFFFCEDSRLFYVSKDGENGIYDFAQGENHLSKSYEDWLHRAIPSKNPNYAFIVGRGDKLYIHNLTSNACFEAIALPEAGVSCIKVVGEYLCVCFVSGRIVFIHLDYEREHFLKLLESRDFEEARSFAQEKNIFLKLEEDYAQIRRENWKEVLEDVIKLFATNQIDNALNTASPYLEDPEIDREFRMHFDKKQAVAEFLKAIEKGAYAKAYQMANEQKSLRGLRAFEELERYFDKILEASKKMLEENYGNQIYRVRKLLEPFLQVPQKRERIEILFNHYGQYSKMVGMIRLRDYKGAHAIAQKYPCLKVTKAYSKVLGHYKDLLLAVQNEILNGASEEIKEQIALLGEVDLFKDEVENLKNFYKMQERIQGAFRDRRFGECYSILEECPDLLSSSCYLQIEESLLAAFRNATELAQMGKTQEVFGVLSEFFVLEKWRRRIDAIFQIAYFYEMKEARDSAIDWRATLKSYVEYFDKNSELEELCAMRGLSSVLGALGEVKKMPLEYKKSILIRGA